VFVVGASLGANAAIVAAANIRPLVTGVVSLSAPATFRLDAVAAARHLQVPVLYAAAEVDHGGIYAADAKTLLAATPVTDKSAVIVPGAGHGVALVAGPGRVRTPSNGSSVCTRPADAARAPVNRQWTCRLMPRRSSGQNTTASTAETISLTVSTFTK
jgi:hypothetical protein